VSYKQAMSLIECLMNMTLCTQEQEMFVECIINKPHHS